MKFFKKAKQFIKNVFSGDYDHATAQLNEFLATGKFPDRCEPKKPQEQIKVEKVEVQKVQVETKYDELTDLNKEIIEVVAEDKNIKVDIK